MEELESFFASLLRRGPIMLIAGELAYLNQILVSTIMTIFIKKYKKSKIIHFYCGGPISLSLRLIKKLRNKAITFHVTNLDEQYYAINLLSLLLSPSYYRGHKILVIFDDFISHYIVSPISRHKTAGGALLAEQLATLRTLSRQATVHVVLTSYLLRDKKPLLWKVFSKYIDALVTIHENDGLVKITFLDKDLNTIESYDIELDELVESLELENAKLSF